MSRTSKRKPKPRKRDDYVESTSDEDSEEVEKYEEDDDSEEEEDPEEDEISEEEKECEENSETSPCPDEPSTSNPPRRPTPPLYFRKTHEQFNAKESVAIFQFILDRIRSKNPARLGRVAKRRVELMRNDLWERCRLAVGKDRDLPASAYRSHFNNYARQLHAYQGISLLDKVDLFYALDIKPDPSFRQRLVQNFEVTFDNSGVITGSQLLHHWDLVHPDSEPECDEDGFTGEYQGSRFTEFEDGLMWEFVVDDVNSRKVRHAYTNWAWKEFKKKNKNRIRISRVAESYRCRFHGILLPNLHKMPFDVITKAVLYFRLGHAVPVEFRSTILEETGAMLDEEGLIADYPDCPAHIVLQSQPYNSIIGITSSSRLSTLKPPTTWADTIPYTPEEDKQIWEYILNKSRVNGKVQKIREKMSGWRFWKKFKEEVATERTWKSLSEHFMEDLRGTIIDLNYDLKTKMELYFTLSVPVEEETLAEFETIASVFLAQGYLIKYATGKKFSIGRKDAVDEINNEMEGVVQRKGNFLNMLALEKRKEAEKKAMEEWDAPNNERFPYLPPKDRSREAERKRHMFIAVAEEEEPIKTETVPTESAELEPKIEEPDAIEEPEHIEQKPTDLLPLEPENVKMEPVEQDFPVKVEENTSEEVYQHHPEVPPETHPEPEITGPLRTILQNTAGIIPYIPCAPAPYIPKNPRRKLRVCEVPERRGAPPPYVPRGINQSGYRPKGNPKPTEGSGRMSYVPIAPKTPVVQEEAGPTFQMGVPYVEPEEDEEEDSEEEEFLEEAPPISYVPYRGPQKSHKFAPVRNVDSAAPIARALPARAPVPYIPRTVPAHRVVNIPPGPSKAVTKPAESGIPEKNAPKMLQRNAPVPANRVVNVPPGPSRVTKSPPTKVVTRPAPYAPEPSRVTVVARVFDVPTCSTAPEVVKVEEPEPEQGILEESFEQEEEQAPPTRLPYKGPLNNAPSRPCALPERRGTPPPYIRPAPRKKKIKAPPIATVPYKGPLNNAPSRTCALPERRGAPPPYIPQIAALRRPPVVARVFDVPSAPVPEEPEPEPVDLEQLAAAILASMPPAAPQEEAKPEGLLPEAPPTTQMTVDAEQDLEDFEQKQEEISNEAPPTNVPYNGPNKSHKFHFNDAPCALPERHGAPPPYIPQSAAGRRSKKVGTRPNEPSCSSAPEVPVPEEPEPESEPVNLEQLAAAILANMPPQEEAKPEGLQAPPTTFQVQLTDLINKALSSSGSSAAPKPFPPRPTGPVTYQGVKRGAYQGEKRSTKPPKRPKYPLTEEQKNQREDKEKRFEEREPNYLNKPALMLAAQLPEIRSTSTTNAVNHVEQRLEMFDKELEATREQMTEEEKNKYREKLLEMAGKLDGSR